MKSFEQVVEYFRAVGSLTKATTNELQAVREEYPAIPDDYVRFLEVAGYGNLDELQLYSGPTSASTIYPNATGRLADILLLGDDFQGYCFGFDPIDRWRMVEVSPRGEIDATEEGDFLSFLSVYIE